MRQHGCDLVFDFVGHGIGLDVHEPPNLIPEDTTVLRENMVIVLEVSTRRHDLGHFSAEIPLLVTEGGCELLSELPYGLAVV